jgi:N-acetylneuraminic acid mutarotase
VRGRGAGGRARRIAAALAASALLLGAACTERPPVRGAPDRPPSAAPSATAPLWRRVADAPTPRQEVAAAALDGRIWVAGGFVAGRASPLVEVYDPGRDRWETGPPLPLAVHHPMAAVQDGRLLVLGGFTHSGEATDRVFVLEGDRWREGPRLRRPRAAGVAVTVGDRVVVVGGIASDRHVAPVEVLEGGHWRDGAPIPSLRDHLAAATDGRLVYAAGGRRAGAQLGSHEAYDPAADRWERLPDLPTPRSGFGAAFVRGLVVTVGGEGPRMFPEVEAFDVATRSWRRLPDMGVPRHGIGVVALGERLYALVGGVRVGLAPSAACEVLELS